MCQKSTAHEQCPVVLVESQGSCALVRIVRLQKFDRRDNMIFTVHLNRLIDENTPLEQSTIETCQQEAYKYQKVTRISCDIGSRFEASWLDCVTMMSEMTIAVIVVSASCHHLTRADSGWSRISWFSRVTLPWLRGGTSVAPWRHKCSHVPVFRRLFDRLPVRISTSDLHHRILRKKLYHIRAYDFGVQFSFNGSKFCLPPSSIHQMTGLGSKMVWTMTYSHSRHWTFAAIVKALHSALLTIDDWALFVRSTFIFLQKRITLSKKQIKNLKVTATVPETVLQRVLELLAQAKNGHRDECRSF